MRRAAKVDANHGDVVAALRKAGATVQSLAALGDGAPDLLVGFENDMWLMEVKHPDRPKARRVANSLQQAWHDRWEGKPVSIVLSAEDALRVIGA